MHVKCDPCTSQIPQEYYEGKFDPIRKKANRVNFHKQIDTVE